jgi:UDP-N-acetylmuramoyl-L-alanyl-D-glutamate--2,6-diaminopimelate ligase
MNIKESIEKFIPKFLLNYYHFCWALAGAVVFGFPGYDKNMKIIGVTGTSGKSTTADFITRILEEAGNKVATQSSIRFKIADKEWENKYKMTMPGRFVIQKFLKQAKRAACKYVVLEVTSQGIEQFRHKFINFDCAIFTNLTPEHIESHGGFGNYRKAKLKLFKATKNIHVINTDDENAKYFLDVPAKQIISFCMKEAENAGIKLNMEGRFNLMNAMAAMSVARAYGIDDTTSKKALEKAKGAAGRMEIVSKSPVKVVVDYAHTPDQLEAVYKTFKDEEMICVLGSCGGGRDKWKRPVLGEIAKKYCNQIIITNEDPYDENPLSIMKEIESALSHDGANPKHYMILDRKEAIETAVKLAKPGQVVIITGKGSEPWMCLENGRKIPWDDRKIARDVLKTIKF